MSRKRMGLRLARRWGDGGSLRTPRTDAGSHKQQAGRLVARDARLAVSVASFPKPVDDPIQLTLESRVPSCHPSCALWLPASLLPRTY